MRRTFRSSQERKAARLIQNREAQQRRRAKIKSIPKPSNPVKYVLEKVTEGYKENLYKGCSGYPFSHSITLTNKVQVTLNMHNKTVEDLIKWLVDNGYISNFIKTNEMCGGNYHSHLVVQANRWGFTFKELLQKNWGNGFFRVVPITTETHRQNAIKYCFKKIDVDSNKELMQKLADTWTISLTQTFEALKEAEKARLNEFKLANGLISKRNTKDEE